MDELQAIRQWYRYNSDLRLKYLRAIARIPAKVRLRDDGASYPLFEIYLHVLDAYRWWFRYVYRDQVRAYPRSRLRTRIRSIEGARRATNRTTSMVRRFLAGLKAKDLDRVVEFTAPANDQWTRWRREQVSLRAMLWHMVEEELQHRGEMNALLWRHRVEPPIIPFTEWSS